MKILIRYIFFEFFPPLFVGIAFFTFILTLPQLKEIIQLKINNNIPTSTILRILVYLIPITATLTIPMGVLFSAIFSLSRLSGDNEIVAISATGTSFKIVMIPTIMFGIFMTFVSFIFINYITPEANLRYQTLYLNMLYSNPGIVLEKRQFINVPNSDKKIAAIETSNDGKSMRWVFIYEDNEEEKEELFIQAERGRWVNNEINSQLVTLELEKGQLLRINKESLDEIEKSRFERINLNIKNEITQIDLVEKSPTNMSALVLNNLAKEQKKNTNNVDSSILIELHKKISYPLACIIFVLIALPLSITSSRSGSGISFGLTTVIIFFYYLLMVAGETMGKQELINPSISMYIPASITLSFAAFLLWQRIYSKF